MDNNITSSHPTTNTPSSTGSGSITDTLKGYVNVAMAKGHVALEQAKVLGHQVHEQINAAGVQAHAQAQAKNPKTAGQDATQISSNMSPQSRPQQLPTANSGNAFADLDQLNDQPDQAASKVAHAANEASSHAGYKSASQSGL
ncbi:hypothetical protein BG004_006063 [Podila humilis]|nr:hypothetical protein BG004_006063 [Podila humilis]